MHMMKFPHNHARTCARGNLFFCVGNTVGTDYIFITKLIISCMSLESVVARGRIELPTHGFSVRFKLLLLNLIG